MTLHEYLSIPSEARSYLEIGCREGDSLRRVVESHGSLERIVVCDTWGGVYGGTGRGGHDHISRLLDELGYMGQVLFLDGDSKVLIPTISVSQRFDLILVDGDHSDEGAEADLRNVYPLLDVGGRILFHDICHPAHPGLRRVFDRFVRDCGGSAEIYEDAEGFGVFSDRAAKVEG